MVATFNPSWRSITAALRLAVIAAGGVPSVTTYPANWGGVIRAVQDLQAALVAAGNANATLAAHVAQADPHAQYALDTDLTGYATTTNLSNHTGNTSNPHNTTAAQTGAIATTAAGAASGVASLDGSTKIPIAQLPTGTTVTTVAIGNDVRLSDTRTPTALSVVDGSVAAAAAIAWSKISKTGAVASDVSATAASHGTANANVHGLPASVNVLGNRNAAGEFIQHGSGTVNGTLGSYTINSFRILAVTFPVAFSAAPRVVTGCGNVNQLNSVGTVTASGCTLVAWGDATLAATAVINYIALGT